MVRISSKRPYLLR